MHGYHFCSHNKQDASLIFPLKHLIEAIGHSMYLFEDDQQTEMYTDSKAFRNDSQIDSLYSEQP